MTPIRGGGNANTSSVTMGRLTDDEQPPGTSSAPTSLLSPPQIRHAGRAHVRGKIRRLWRPRFMELLDQGIVHYYEFPSHSTAVAPGSDCKYYSGTTTTTTAAAEDSSWESFLWGSNAHHSSNKDDLLPATAANDSWTPKYILQISHARILDVTTLRDMHVGLPRGTFGFTFRGQRLLHLEHAAAAATTTRGQWHGSTNSPVAITPIVLEPRDFLCAVTTLEEAQTWVVALQWAASERMVVESLQDLERQQQQQQQMYSSSMVVVEAEQASIGTNDSGGASGFVNVVTTATTSRAAAGSNRVTPGQSSSSHRSVSSPNATPAAGTAVAGKRVVTKVVAVRVVRIAQWSWQVAYEIRGLLVSRDSAQEFTALRTADDLLHLLHALNQELRSSCSGKDCMNDGGGGDDDDDDDLPDMDQFWKPLKSLPRLQPFSKKQQHQQRIGRSGSSPTCAFLSLGTLTKSLEASIAVVDHILRALVTDARMVQSLAMRSFLGLSSWSTSKKQQPLQPISRRLWNYHNGQGLSQQTQFEQVVTQDTSMDAYVRQWLAKQQKSSTATMNSKAQWDITAAYLLQRPLYVLSGVTLSSLAALWPLAKWAFSFCDQVLPALTVRVDVLAVTWIGAAYLGYQYHAATTTVPPVPTLTNARSRRQQQSISSAQRPSSLEPKQLQTGPERVAPARNMGVVADAEEGTILEDDDSSSEGESADAVATAAAAKLNEGKLPSPLPKHPGNNGKSCWSQPPHHIFHVCSATYLQDRVKEPSGPAPLTCRGTDVWLTDNPERHIARHPAVLGGKLDDEDTFLVNFLLPFGNFVTYFSIPPLVQFPKKLRNVWTKFLKGDQQYRDARLKLLPVVAEGPWIVKAAVGPGKSPALLGKVIPLQYFFKDATKQSKAVYEVDVIITASSIAKGILSVVKGNTKSVSLAFAFIIEAAEQDELPETVLCSCQVHALDLEKCPVLPPCNLDQVEIEE